MVLSRRISNAALPICMAGMDGCWIFIVAWLVSTQVLWRLAVLPVPPPLLLALVELAGLWFVSRLFSRSRLPDLGIQLLSGLAGLAVSVLVVFLYSPPGAEGLTARWAGGAAVGVAVCLVLWFLGGYRATEPADFNQAYAMFRVGFIAVGVSAGLVAVSAHEQSTAIWAPVGSAALWFFGWSLGALALGNREVVREESGSKATGSWGGVLIVSVGVILLVGAIGGAFGAGGVLDVARTVVTGFLSVLAFIAYGIVYIGYLILKLINPNIDFTKPRPPSPEEITAVLARWRDLANRTPQAVAKATGIPEQLITLMLWVGGITLLVVIIVFLSRKLRRTNRFTRDDALEEREQLGSWRLFVQQVLAWLMRLFGRKGAQTGQLMDQEDDLAALAGKPEWSGTLTVRQIYARMQKLAASAGYKRELRQTPLEYLRVLQSAMPDLRSDFAAITSAYIEARYGPVPASGPAVYAAQQAWKRAEPELAARGQDRR